MPVIQVAAPTIRYLKLYPLAPATAVQAIVAVLCVTDEEDKPAGVLHGGAGVENVEEDEKALELLAEQTDLT